jgi:hypothetical protein
MGHRVREQLDEIAHDKLFAVVSFQKLAQYGAVGMVRPWHTGGDLHEVLNLLGSERPTPIVIPSAKEDVCQKGDRPCPPIAQSVRRVHVQGTMSKKSSTMTFNVGFKKLDLIALLFNDIFDKVTYRNNANDFVFIKYWQVPDVFVNHDGHALI